MRENFQMCQLMVNHIIQNRRRRFDEFPVERQIAAAGTAAPTTALIADRDAAIAVTNCFTDFLYALNDELLGMTALPDGQRIFPVRAQVAVEDECLV